MSDVLEPREPHREGELHAPGGSARSSSLLLALVFSLLVNLLLAAGMFGAHLLPGRPANPDASNRLPRQDEPKLELDELGFDPPLKLAQDLNRVEEVCVPGLVLDDEELGIARREERMPTTLPRPRPLRLDHFSREKTVFPWEDELLERWMAPTPEQARALNDHTHRVGSLPAPDEGSIVGSGCFVRRRHYSQRLSGATRWELLRKEGGNRASEEAVASGLRWLAVRHRWTGLPRCSRSDP